MCVHSRDVVLGDDELRSAVRGDDASDCCQSTAEEASEFCGCDGSCWEELSDDCDCSS